ncbi:aminoacyl-tRNA hydrolase [Niabella beijingensis]|uniref:aminoacyl-tRNA hydrolase n=1 Tax=Niabella beijingensis TaxID=2872700 RepID=UPI001CBC56C1|nr:aminoacyl-tRNA hydrolase [Niabella beijingensis]MBZ4192349.1 aminoacyl-tRNA hydrolase [Niabella beijingensis]
MKYLLAGLGNIGNEYAHTRHNIGFDVIAAFVHKHGGEFRSDRLAYVAEVKIKGRTGICICPTTYMNLSGKALKFWLEKEKIPLERSLTVLDDLALPLSKMRIKPAGSDGGHNGLRSIQAVLNTTAYPKLRFGIGNAFPKGMQSEFVLGKWGREEEPLVKLKVDKAVAAIETFLFQGIEAAMNEINSKEFTL